MGRPQRIDPGPSGHPAGDQLIWRNDMSYPPAGGDNPPPAPGGTVYGNVYGSRPAPQQYDPNQPAPTLHQPTAPDGAPCPLYTSPSPRDA
ncbi:hypothetical protein DLJ57_29210 [Micromonospora chalcea]|nr:hypothetical protein DLJ57_29210 [Micromonospora chalcea]